VPHLNFDYGIKTTYLIQLKENFMGDSSQNISTLATSKEVTELNETDTSIKLFLNDKIRMGAVYKFIHANYNETPDV